MDVDAATLNLVKDGTIDSTIAQKPFTMGLLGLKELDDVYHYPVKPLAQDYSLDPNAPFPAFELSRWRGGCCCIGGPPAFSTV
jgi:ribose transport system substrate-binding protein